MESNEVAIKVDSVSKDFKLNPEKVDSLKGAFVSLFSKKSKNKYVLHALKNITFEVKKGEFFGIVGRNGSGKSTLLKILANIYQPTSGKMSTHGKLVPFIELGVGFNQELTGKENVYLNGAILGFSVKEVDKMYSSIVEFAELERFMDQKLKNYSSGMQVRLAFSAAIRANADILLIDEVLAVGDDDFKRKCYDYFKKLKKDNKTVIFVSHDMSAIREYCDRAILIDENHIVAAGTANNISQKYAQLFIEDQNSEEQSDEQNRWGDGKAKVTSIKAEVKGDRILIKQTIKAKSNIDHPVVGFRIRDKSGNEVTGTNSRIEKQKIPNLSRGESLTLNWDMPNVLGDGEYYLDPAILHDDGLTVMDWWDEACTLKIKKDRHLPYNMDPGFDMSMDKTSHE